MRYINRFLIIVVVLLLEMPVGVLGGDGKVAVTTIMVYSDKAVLNPVLNPDDFATLSVKAIMSDGTVKQLSNNGITFSSVPKITSGNVPVVAVKGNKVIPKEGGIATITAVCIISGQTFTASLDITVRPYYREYHKTLVMKLMMGMEGEPVPQLANETMFLKPHDVLSTFEEALEVVRKTDNMTRGIPKIIYLVGWQKGGHDHQYPSWSEVNPKLKRSQDANALSSLRWLIREARRYNTTISLHINMVDAYRSSPLWEEYVKKDIIAKDTNGRFIVNTIQIQGDSMYHLSYTREWEEGLAQKRIDALISMIPELKEGHTIHIDVFIARGEFLQTISPWHALPRNGRIDTYKEVATQRKIFNYWRERGFDVTGEGIFWLHPPGEGFQGLQPMTWWYPADISYQMQTPENLSARGRTHRKGDGDFRFGSSMQGEEIFNQDKEKMPGFLQQFCRTTLPWQYLSSLNRLALINDTLFYSGGVKAAKENGHNIIRKGNFLLRDDDDLFVPALWKQKEIIAYSENGYKERTWLMPEDWKNITQVDVYKFSMDGAEIMERSKKVINGRIGLSLDKESAVYIIPSAR